MGFCFLFDSRIQTGNTSARFFISIYVLSFIIVLKTNLYIHVDNTLIGKFPIKIKIPV